MLLTMGLLFLSSAQKPAFAADIELKLQSHYPEVHYTVKTAIKPWMKTVEERSGGKVKIHFFPQRAIAKEEETYDAVKVGLLDIGTASTSRPPGKFPLNDLITLPLLFPDAKVGSLAVWEIYKRFPAWQKEFSATKVLWEWTSAPFQIATTKKPVLKLEDLKGLKIIGWIPTLLEIIRALGANPMQVPPLDTYLALERGMADGVCTPYAPMRSLKLSDATKHHTSAGILVMPFYAAMNQSKFNSLPPDIQKIIETTGGDMARICGEALNRGQAEDVKWMKSKGLKFYDLPAEEKKRWVKAIMPIREKWLNKMESKGYKNIREMFKTAIELSEKLTK